MDGLTNNQYKSLDIISKTIVDLFGDYRTELGFIREDLLRNVIPELKKEATEHLIRVAIIFPSFITSFIILPFTPETPINIMSFAILSIILLFWFFYGEQRIGKIYNKKDKYISQIQSFKDRESTLIALHAKLNNNLTKKQKEDWQ